MAAASTERAEGLLHQALLGRWKTELRSTVDFGRVGDSLTPQAGNQSFLTNQKNAWLRASLWAWLDPRVESGPAERTRANSTTYSARKLSMSLSDISTGYIGQRLTMCTYRYVAIGLGRQIRYMRMFAADIARMQSVRVSE